MRDKKVSIVLVGISGYGYFYLSEIFKNSQPDFYLAGVVDIDPPKSDYYQEIVKRNISIYRSIEEFYQENQADLAIISTPIQLHKEQACLAMNKGSHVLTEKPLTANPDDIKELIGTRDRTGKSLAVGFNWSFAPSTQQLKKNILSGRFGKAIRAKSKVLWGRNDDYYQRSNWAGKKYSPDGQMIFDSVANNATAHFLHHLLYLTGDSITTSAQLNHLTAELYKANDIETFDTCAVQLKTSSNIDIFYFASHAVKVNDHPRFMLEFEHATIEYQLDETGSKVVAVMEGGSKLIYEDPEKHFMEKLHICTTAILEDNQDILCGIEAATTHVQSIFAMHQSVPDTPIFPRELIKRNHELRLNWVDGLEVTLIDCYENWSLPSDLGVHWSKRGKLIEIK